MKVQIRTYGAYTDTNNRESSLDVTLQRLSQRLARDARLRSSTAAWTPISSACQHDSKDIDHDSNNSLGLRPHGLPRLTDLVQQIRGSHFTTEHFSGSLEVSLRATKFERTQC